MYTDFLLRAAKCFLEDVACLVLLTDVAYEETYFLNSGFSIEVWEVEASVFGRAMDYVPCYCRDYPAFL